jgi:hypothetical protein
MTHSLDEIRHKAFLIGEHRHLVGAAILTECKRYFYKENRIGCRAFCVVTVTRFRLPDGPSSDDRRHKLLIG